MAMRISDCIRNWCASKDGHFIDAIDCDELRDLADRIDREMAELPKDADGVPIHVGDLVYGCTSHVKMTITELRIVDSRWAVYVDGCTCRIYALDVTHACPDSLERIAQDMEDWSEDNRVNGDSEVFDRAADFAERIRKLAAKE